MPAFQPNWLAMKAVSQFQVRCDHQHGWRGVGGQCAPNGNIHKQDTRSGVLEALRHVRPEDLGASIRAAKVMAAGSVISEPSSGTTAKPSHASTSGAGKGLSS